MPSLKRENKTTRNSVDGTSGAKLHDVKEATEWHMPPQQADVTSNPQHREDFDALVATAVKGKKAGA